MLEEGEENKKVKRDMIKGINDSLKSTTITKIQNIGLEVLDDKT